MTTDYRALCAELADDLQEARDAVSDWAAYASDHFKQKHDLQGELDRIQRQIDRARAALAQQESAGPTDEELYDLAAEYDGEPVQSMRAALARYGRPAITPIHVGERLPGAEDCDKEGRCWVFDKGDADRQPMWHMAFADDLWAIKQMEGRPLVNASLERYRSHWLPHHALPLPSPSCPQQP